MSTLFIDYYHSPIGFIRLEADENGITVVHFDDSNEQASVNSSSILKEATRQLDEYFKGSRKIFDLEISPAGTQFQQKVWHELQVIPFGGTATYLQMAKRLGNVKSIRAAASANGKNPIALIIPCHRVIGADGKLTGYAGGLHRKKWLLEHEAKVMGQSTIF